MGGSYFVRSASKMARRIKRIKKKSGDTVI